MSQSLVPEPVCRMCLYTLPPGGTDDGLCALCRPVMAHQNERCAQCLGTGWHDGCDGQAWCDVLSTMVNCDCQCEHFPTGATR